MTDTTPSSVLIGRVCEEIKQLLLQKNQAYGDSALHPVRIFSRADPLEQINIRIDDKLSRLAQGSDPGEDTELDLIGYLILKRVARLREQPDPPSPYELVGIREQPDPPPAWGGLGGESPYAASRATEYVERLREAIAPASLGGYIPEDP